jgi:Na+/proline symporter
MGRGLRKIVVGLLAGASVWVLMWPRLMSWPDYSLYAASAWAMVVIALIIQGWALDAMEVERNRPGNRNASATADSPKGASTP